MTTIAWYGVGYEVPQTDGYGGDPGRLPSTTHIGTASNTSASVMDAGFVGEPAVGTITFVNSWAAVGYAPAPNVYLETYDSMSWNGSDWEVVATHQYIRVDLNVDNHGVLRIRVKEDGVFCDGVLVLTTAPDGFGYSNLAWDWEAAAPEPVGLFWTDLVSATQT